MDEKDLEQLAREERERAEAEFAKMQQALAHSDTEINAQQKDVVKKKINNHFEDLNAKKSTVWIFLLLFVILAGSYYSLTFYKPRVTYAKAMECLEKGEYDNAKILFTNLGDYENAAELVNECDYRKGNLLLATGKYTSALTALSGITGYKDRDDLIADLAGDFAKTLDTGKWHSAFVRSVGTVKATGDNTYGQCNVDDWKNVVQIACGDYLTIAKTSNNDVLCTGAVLDWHNIKEVAAGTDFAAGLTNDGQLLFHKGSEDETISGIKHISAKKNILACIGNGGGAVVSGAAIDTQLFTDLKEIETDGQGVYALKNDGTVISSNGRLSGVGNVKHIFTANETMVAVTNDNMLIADGAVSTDELEGMLMLSGTDDHFIMLTDTGHVKYYGPSYAGSGRVADWTDVLLNLREQ